MDDRHTGQKLLLVKKKKKKCIKCNRDDMLSPGDII